MDSGVIYIDTEGTFRPERLEQIARARGLDHRDVLRSVAVCKIYNSSHLELIIKDLGKYVNDFKAKLVIIDGIISLHRAEKSRSSSCWKQYWSSDSHACRTVLK